MSFYGVIHSNDGVTVVAVHVQVINHKLKLKVQYSQLQESSIKIIKTKTSNLITCIL